MKMNFKFLALAAAALTFAACTDELVQTPEQVRNNSPESNAISFSTYMGRTGMTRAGEPGAIGTDTLKGFKYDNSTHTETWSQANALKYGFGVFAYYTGTNKYEDYKWFYGGTVDQSVANFMFNQQVWWSENLSNDYITKWTYAPVKYWPNEVSTTSPFKDDDQDNDTGNDPATTSGHGASGTDYYGGNVSFFAYAPYVSLPINATTSGIVAINKQTVLANANAATTEPTLTYIIAEKGNEIVDLLWGTKGNTSVNVLNAAQPGVPSTATTVEYGEAISSTANDMTYAKNILKGYTTNADLTKQMTNGKVDFAFKHALAKVGGSTTTTTTTTTSNVKNGLMVILDLDDMKGAETGGEKDATTKVTVKEVKIVARTLVENNNKKPGEDGYQPAYMKTLQGDFNLATGKWTYFTGSSNDNLDTNGTTNPAYKDAKTTTTIITQDGIKDKNNGTENVTGRLADAIKEPIEAVGTDWTKVPAGVLTTAQNVYANEAFPLVFIPGTYPELIVTIDYLVRTQDENLATAASGEGTWTKVEQVITKKLTFTKPVELNKQYSILMHLGLTSVKFTASVSNWEPATDDPNNFDSDDDGTPDIKVEDVYLPINVGGLMVKYANGNKAASSATSIAKDGNYTYYVLNKLNTADVAKLALDETYSSNKASWITGVSTTDGSLTLQANTTYADREGTVKVKFVDGETKQYSDIITILQKGRTPSEAAITWTTEPTITNIVKAGNSAGIDYTISKMEVKGNETKVDGTADAAFTDEIAAADYELVFIDEATGEKATWIDLSTSGKIKVSANPYNTDRKANLFIKLKSTSGKNYNKLIPVKASSSQLQLTQKGTAA